MSLWWPGVHAICIMLMYIDNSEKPNARVYIGSYYIGYSHKASHGVIEYKESWKSWNKFAWWALHRIFRSPFRHQLSKPFFVNVGYEKIGQKKQNRNASLTNWSPGLLEVLKYCRRSRLISPKAHGSEMDSSVEFVVLKFWQLGNKNRHHQGASCTVSVHVVITQAA